MPDELSQLIVGIKWLGSVGREAAKQFQLAVEDDEQLDVALEEASAWFDDIIASNKIA